MPDRSPRAVSSRVVVPNLPVILASASPRRRELLAQLIPDFEVVPANVDEEALTLSDPWKTAERLAEAKATVISQQRPDALVLGSDTVVAFEAQEGFQQLAKPIDAEDAKKMLRALSGRTHLVITGIALLAPTSKQVASDTTQVTFRELGDQEIADYVESGEPMDKAGGYAIQGGAAGFVDETEGSISNVIGLPLELLEKMIETV